MFVGSPDRLRAWQSCRFRPHPSARTACANLRPGTERTRKRRVRRADACRCNPRRLLSGNAARHSHELFPVSRSWFSIASPRVSESCTRRQFLKTCFRAALTNRPKWTPQTNPRSRHGPGIHDSRVFGSFAVDPLLHAPREFPQFRTVVPMSRQGPQYAFRWLAAS